MNKQPSILSGIFRQPFAEQVAFFRSKLGNLVPTERWDDITGAAHDRAFMVAGAAKADLLTDLAAAVDRSISEGRTLDDFRKDFMTIIERRGWKNFTGSTSAARLAWRTRIIYQTNCTTSYAAGREAQIREGGFAFKVYRHNDSVAYPRLHHVAWDGLTLPIDHVFWTTHSPPNGWGCKCYVLGAKSEQAARRLGGDPDKKLPVSWDESDEETGTPVGIDEGWDYTPGASVATEITQMATKTQQWEYTIAKAYMQEVPETQRDALATAYRDLPSVADDVRRYAQAVVEGRKVAPYRTMGLLTGKDATEVMELTGKSVAGFDFAVDASTVSHVKRKHGAGTGEEKRGQRAAEPADYARLPAILNAPDQIREKGISGVGLPIVQYIKTIDGETFTTAFELRKGRKMLVLQSMWIKTKTTP